ncbi:hypothetical protein [Nocardioides sp. CER19]|uniref:hypothetical protein n=1 Tax=Nocardioides sp. CER19 TaxID=3038538 RepID=UPI00244B583F|nr:hypothetical protein [Nocardioides sp. CER19]MDH2416163.1 hypothetical protein [Nocardioides sp. CER19]
MANMTDSEADDKNRRILTEDVRSMPLTTPSQPGMWIDGGWPTAATQTLAVLGGARVAAWEISAGVASDVEEDECVVVLSGRGTIRFEHGDEDSTQTRDGPPAQGWRTHGVDRSRRSSRSRHLRNGGR